MKDRAMSGLNEIAAEITREAMRERAGIRKPGDPVTPKRLRPRCGAKTRTGRPCQAPAMWDKKLDMPVNGRCRRHRGRVPKRRDDR